MNIPSALHVCENDLASVYHIFGEWEYLYPMFDKLWALGFRDVDTIDEHGNLPLTLFRVNAEVALWLIEHGADYWTPLGGRSDYPVVTEQATPAHRLAASIRSWIRWGVEGNEDLGTQRQVLEKSLQVRVHDTCSCECSLGGCTTLSAYFSGRRWQHDWQSYEHPLSLRDLFPWGCVDLFQAFQFSFTKEDLVAIIRWMTFDALELTHTCCDLRETLSSRERHTPEEVDEINSEQAILLALFATLLVEFEQIAYEDQSGVPLIVNDPEEFWIRRWLPRMSEILDDLDGNELTEDEISGAEAIGVVWGPQPAEKPATERVQEGWLQRHTLKNVMKQLEEIMNE